MSLKVTLAAERTRRVTAEAEVARLRALLASAGPGSEPERSVAPCRADLLQLLIDASPNLVSITDENDNCILANDTCRALLARQPRREAQAAGSGPPPALLRASTSYEERVELPDGEVLWLHTTKSPLVQADGRHYVFTFSTNITPLKQSRHEAEDSARARELFMANMSHEIRTPLHGVMGLAELLLKGPLTPEQTDYVEMIQSSTGNLLVVIDDILTFTKIEAGEISLENIPFDLAKTVREAVRSLRFKMDEKGLLLRLEGLDEPLPLALGDPFRLHQVLMNLVGNAIKFTHHGTITISVDASARTHHTLPVTFRVTDTGIGIRAEHLEGLFDSYRQADSSIARRYGGTGLGLSICRKLVELQGGHIGVSSVPGQGSTFSFTLPYGVSQTPLQQVPTVIQDPGRLRGLSVLLAEDDAINQLIAVSMLGQWGVRVEMAQNGEEALAKALANPFDVVLMDIQMPLLDGLDATQRLRSLPGPNQHTPTVALTADVFRIDADSREALGFTAFLTKPYSELALFNLLARVSRREPPSTEVASFVGLPDAGGTMPAYDFAAGLEEVPVMTDALLTYDLSGLGRLSTDAGFVRKLLELFMAQVPEQVAGLETAMLEGNWEAAARRAHRLKTTFGSLSIQPTTGQLRRLEKLAEAGVFHEEMPPLLKAVAAATRRYMALFREELAMAEHADV